MDASTVSKSSSNGHTKAKHWTFTIINPNDAHFSKFEDIKEFTTYWIYGQEIAPTTGTPHLQCYLVGKKQITLPTMRRWFGTSDGNTYIVSNGTPQQNRTYCSKDGKFQEWGELPPARHSAGGEATKKKWEDIAKNAKDGQMDVIYNEHPKEFVTNYRTLKQIGFDFQQIPENLKQPCGEWIYGESGVGKSFTARKENPNAFIKPMNKWWDNYQKQDTIIIEDMSPAFAQSMEYFFKIWPDCYSFPAEIKNHTVQIRPKKIVVTSQYHPKQIWQGEALDAILRRFTIRNLLKINDHTNELIVNKKLVTKDVKPKKHDLPFLKNPSKFKVKDGKLVANTQLQQKINEKFEQDAQDVDALIDCAEIESMGGFMNDSGSYEVTSSDQDEYYSYSMDSTESSDMCY